MKTYIILQLMLNAITGQPLEIKHYNDVPYVTYDECARVMSDIPPQVPDADGHVKVFTCATAKEVTTL